METDFQPGAVTVTGLPDHKRDILTSILIAYFSDKKKSGGGPLVTTEAFPGVVLIRNGTVAIVLFQNTSDADSVVAKNDHRLKIEGSTADISASRCTKAFFKMNCPEEILHSVKASGDPPPDVSIPDSEPMTLDLRESDDYSLISNVSEASPGFQFQALPGGQVLKNSTTQQSELLDVGPKSPPKRKVLVPEEEPQSTKKIVVSPISEGMTPDILQLYFENKNKSGGGPTVGVEMHGKRAIIEFEDAKDASSVLAKGNHIIQERNYQVEPFVEGKPKAKGAQENIVIITGVKPPLDMEFLELWLESAGNGGGSLKRMERDEQNSVITVEFENTSCAETMLAMKTADIKGVTVTFSQKGAFDDDTDDEDDDSLTLIATGFDKTSDTEILTLFFENEKKSGGGALKSIEVDQEAVSAILCYEDINVAKRVLARANTGDLVLQNKRLTVKKVVKAKWDGKTVEVNGLQHEINVELLLLLFENKRKSGGGKTEDIQIHGTTAFIRFADGSVADRVIEKGEVTISGATLIMSKPNLNKGKRSSHIKAKEEIAPVKEISVCGIKAGITRDVLEMFFENEGKSGGGEVEAIRFDERKGSATITFKDPAVAERVAKKKKLNFFGSVLHVQLMMSMHGSTLGDHFDSMHHSKGEEKLALEVTGIPLRVKEDYLSLFFESEKTSGGGATENIDFDQETGTAMIYFKETETLDRVMQRYRDSGRRGLVIEGSKLSLKTIDVSKCPQTVKDTCAIMVKGAPANSTDDTIRFFFENRRRSGGGDIEEFIHLESGTVITFEESEVAARVFQKHMSDPLRMENVQIDVKLLKNGHRPKFLDEDVILQPKTLFLEDIPENAEGKDVKKYLQKMQNCEVEDAWFGLQRGRAIVHFFTMPEYQQVYRFCCLKPFKGHMIGVQCVEKPKSIEVYNISKLSEQKLEMYFEHKRSGGGEIEDLKVNTDENYAIVTFAKYGVAESVVAKTTHKMDDTPLKVGLHYECLGILPPGHDRTTPRGSIPDDIFIEPLDMDILMFVASTTTNKTLMEETLQRVDACMLWPEELTEHSNGATVQCTLNAARVSPNIKAEWPDKAKAAFLQVFDLFTTDKVNVLQEGWRDFCSQAGNLKVKNDSIEVITDDDACEVKVVGKKGPVLQFMKNIYQAKGDVEEAITRKKKSITEELKNQAPYKVRFVQTVKFPQELKQIFPNASVDCNVKSKKITIKGLSDEVQTIKLRLLEMMNEIITETLAMSPKCIELLKEKKTRECIVKEFQQRGIFMMFETDKTPNVLCCARKPEDLTSGKAVLKTAIVETSMDIKPENQQTLHSDGWARLLKTLRTDYKGELLLEVADDESCCNIVCVADISAGVLETMIMFLKDNTTLQQFITMDDGTQKFVKKYRQNELETIKQKFQLEVEFVDRDRKGLVIKGVEQNLKTGTPQVVAIAKKVTMCTHGINKPGMPKYFVSQRGRDYLESLEDKFKAIIIPGGKNPEASSLTSMLSTVAPVAFKEPKIKSKIVLDTGHAILVVEGDLTEYKVDVIVNAANEDLAHVGGIAKAIVDKGGPSIQDECDQFIKARNRLRPGAIFASEAGKLPCKKIIHAVGPRWQGGYRGEENTLYECVYKSLEATCKIGQQTIGVPAISSGVFGFPLAVACKNIVEAIGDFCQEDNQLTEIHLVDPNMKSVDAFHEEVCRKFGKKNVTLMSEGSTRRGKGPKSNLNKTTKAEVKVDPYWSKGTVPHSLVTKENITVTSIKGEIGKQQVDVIVNTTSKDLNLGSGGVSASILKAAGPSIQAECQQKSPGGVTQGDIVETSGGNISCKQIYHGSLPNWNSNDTTLRKFCKLCLDKAHQAGMTSIAFPALGTGNLGYPRDKVAEVMYDEVRRFSQANPRTSLKDIRFVVYDQPTVDCFGNEIKKLEQNLAPKELGKSHGGRKLRMSSSLESMGAGARHPPPPRHSDSYQSTWPEPSRDRTTGLVQLVIRDNLTIQVAQGDITNETTDIIVNSTNSKLVMGSQVSQAILRKGGHEVERECIKLGHTNKEGVAITTAGRLPCKHIIHVDIPRPEDISFFRGSPWEKRIKAILKLANEKKCESISIPALGTGMADVSPADMAETMLKAITSFCLDKKGLHLKLIRIVIFQDKMVSTYQRSLEGFSKKTKGFIERISGVFSGDFGSSVDRDMSFERSDSISMTPVHLAKLSFLIYATDQGSINAITGKIDDACRNESKEQVIESMKDQEIIKNLTDEQISAIMAMENTYQVQIEVQKTGRLSKIIVRGAVEDALTVVTEIQKIFRELDEQKAFEDHADMIFKQVQWEVDEGTGFEQYPPPISATIEKAYNARKTEVEFREELDDGTLRVCRVNFNDMVEILQNDTSQQHPVKRTTPDTISIPSTWDTMKTGEQYLVVPLTAGVNEYTVVETKFKNSMSAGGSTYNQIIGIKRIQNPQLYQKYQVHKKFMEATNPPGTQNEKELWHGTSVDALDEIHASGFNRGFCGKNGTAYGKGVYFATFASLSHGYARPDASGHKHMYLSKVLSGEFIRGNPSFIVPPPKNPANKAIKYDSVVDNEAGPKIYVIFFDNQAYPDYLVTFM